ncbi:MAG: hypothetical protein PHV06_11625, partial [bacterium]|nr:hypothetical protein [bacterium]
MKKLILISIISIILAGAVFGFGMNKVRYDRFDWKVKETKHFDIYYYPEMEPMINWTADEFENAYSYLSKRYDFGLTFRPPIILYKNHRHFEQTNIMEGFIPGNVGGFSEIIKKRIVIPVNGSRYSLEKLIVHELNHLFQFDYFYQNKLQFLGAVPMYIMEGCSESFSYDWDMEGLLILRDAFLNNRFYTLMEMRNFYMVPDVYLCYKESHSFIDFLLEKYGEEKLKLLFRNIRRSPMMNFDKTFNDTYNLSEEELSNLWINHMKKKFWPMIEKKDVPEISFGKPMAEGGDYVNTFKPAYFPSGDLFVYITTKNQQFDIYVRGNDNKENIKRLTKQDDLLFEYILVEGNAISVSPDGNLVAAFVRDNEADKLLLINVITEKAEKIKLEGFESLSSPSWGS